MVRALLLSSNHSDVIWCDCCAVNVYVGSCTVLNVNISVCASLTGRGNEVRNQRRTQSGGNHRVLL